MSDSNEIQENTNQIQKNEIIDGKEVVRLINETLEEISNDRQKALSLLEKITEKEFEKTFEIMYKGEIAAKFLELAGKSTAEKNKLLSIIQKFNSDKVKSENVDKVLNSTDYNNIIALCDQLGIVPNQRFSSKDNIKEELKKETLQDATFIDDDGINNEYTEFEDDE